MNRLKTAVALLLIAGCASFNAYEKGRSAEKVKNWDEAVIQYTKALDIDPDNMRYRINLQRAKLEASRNHFEKGKRRRANHSCGFCSSRLPSSRSPSSSILQISTPPSSMEKPSR